MLHSAPEQEGLSPWYYCTALSTAASQLEHALSDLFRVADSGKLMLMLHQHDHYHPDTPPPVPCVALGTPAPPEQRFHMDRPPSDRDFSQLRLPRFAGAHTALRAQPTAGGGTDTMGPTLAMPSYGRCCRDPASTSPSSPSAASTPLSHPGLPLTTATRPPAPASTPSSTPPDPTAHPPPLQAPVTSRPHSSEPHAKHLHTGIPPSSLWLRPDTPATYGTLWRSLQCGPHHVALAGYTTSRAANLRVGSLNTNGLTSPMLTELLWYMRLEQLDVFFMLDTRTPLRKVARSPGPQLPGSR